MTHDSKTEAGGAALADKLERLYREDKISINQVAKEACAALRAPAQSCDAECALPPLPDDDADFTPELVRKIIAKYQQLLSSPPPVGARNDLGIVLSALRHFEEIVGERYDDEGGIVAQIERDHAGLTPTPAAGTATNIGAYIDDNTEDL